MEVAPPPRRHRSRGRSRRLRAIRDSILLRLHRGRNIVARHVRITCPQCRRDDLRIRPEYLGRQVSCKYCSHRFLARAPDQPGTETLPAGPALQSQIAVDAINEAGHRAMALEREIERLRSELNTRTGEYNAALQQLRDAEGRLGQSRGQARDVQEQLDQALVQLRRVSEQRDELAEADAERVRLLSQVEVLRAVPPMRAAWRMNSGRNAPRLNVLRASSRGRESCQASPLPRPTKPWSESWRSSVPNATHSGERFRVSGLSSMPVRPIARGSIN